MAQQASRPVVLSGGLNPENAADAVLRVRPTAIDTASGVESAPGHKDATKMRALVAAVSAWGADR
jgi:phosphoribosylanthranilate isomerase